MIVVARLHSDKSPGTIWDCIMEHHEEMNARLGEDVKLLYATRRAKYEDVSLFMHVNDIDIMGDFISQEISKIDCVDGVWIFNLINPRFFPVPEGTLPNLPRFTLTAHVYPMHLQLVYNVLCATEATPELAVMYVANTFHVQGESIMVSVLAKDKKIVKDFKSKKIESLPGVLRTRTYDIMSTHRLLPRDEWERYANIFPEERIA